MNTRQTIRTDLGNRLDTVVVTEPGMPLAEIRLVLPYARTASEWAACQELLAACLGTGTIDRGRQDIADHLADLGAEFSTTVTTEYLVLSVSVLADGLTGALELLADLLIRPAYRREVTTLAARRAGRQPRTPGPRTTLRQAFMRRAFGDPHPLLGPPATAAEIQAVTEGGLYELHRRAIVPDEAVLLVMSSAPPETVLTLLRERLLPWTGGPSGLTLPPFTQPDPAPGRFAVHDADAGQALLLTAGPAVPSTSPDHAALHLVRLVLGGYGSSRLFRRVREQNALAYTVSTRMRETRAGCWLETECAGAPGSADRLAEEVIGCLTELARTGPTAGEADRARRYASGFTRFALATRAEEAGALAGFAAGGLDLDWLVSYPDVLAAVTDRDVREAAGRFLSPDAALTATLDTAPGTGEPGDEQRGSGR